MKDLYKEADVNVHIDKLARTPAHRAAISGDTEALKDCKRADLDTKDVYHKTPAHYAAENEHTEILKALEGAGANLEAEDGYGRTPVHLAAINGDTKTLKYLAEEAKVKLNVQDIIGRTPAHEAALKNTEALKVLIENKVKLNVQDINGRTPAHEAALKNTEALKVLIENKAKLNVIDKDGETPLDIAYYKYFNIPYKYFRLLLLGKNIKIINLLKKAGAKTGEELREEEKQKAAFGRVGRPCDGGNKGPSR